MPEETEEQQESTRPFWSGTITFGLVSIPVNLFPANRTSRVSLRMLGPTGKPLSRKYYSDKTGKDLASDDLIRGYEIRKNRFIEVTDEELERLAPERSRDINLRRFVDQNTIPRLYFERGYFLAPASSARAYHLLAETMARTNRAGIATFVMRGKEYLVAITADHGILRAETMRFHDEVRSPEDVGLPKKEKAAPATLKSMEKLVMDHSRASLPQAELKDKASERLRQLIERKRKKQDHIVGSPGKSRKNAEVVDLLEVLRQSLGQSRASKRKRARR